MPTAAARIAVLGSTPTNPRAAIAQAIGNNGGRPQKRRRAAAPSSHEGLLHKAFDLIQRAWASSTDGKARTALRRLEDYLRQYNIQEPFRETLSDPAAAVHNELTLIGWIVSMVEDGLSHGTISSYVSLAKTALSIRLGWAITAKGSEVRLPRLLKGILRSKPAASRKRRLGWRAAHMRKLRNALGLPIGVEETAADSVLNLARQGLFRGADFLPERHADFKPKWYPTVGDWTIREVNGRTFAQGLVRPAKRGEEQPKCELFHMPKGDGVVDGFSSIERHLAARVAANGGHPLHPDAPLITHANGRSWTVKEMRTLIRDAGARIGLDPKELGAHSARIGGATDHFASGCPSGVIQILGRWCAQLQQQQQRSAQALFPPFLQFPKRTEPNQTPNQSDRTEPNRTVYRLSQTRPSPHKPQTGIRTSGPSTRGSASTTRSTTSRTPRSSSTPTSRASTRATRSPRTAEHESCPRST